MATLFVTPDGTWGDTEGLRIIEVTDEQLTYLNDANEHEMLETLNQLNTLIVFPSYHTPVQISTRYDEPDPFIAADFEATAMSGQSVEIHKKSTDQYKTFVISDLVGDRFK